MNYISDSFFHFTNSIDNLLNILSGNFYAHFSNEDVSFLYPSGINKYMAIPMVCFCDIPLTLVNEHVNDYGPFAIGLKHNWGITNLNPVFYMQDHSLACKSFHGIQDFLFQFEKSPEIKDMFYSYLDFISFMKKYKGKSNRNITNDKIFYNEREWRWVPKIDSKLLTDNKVLRQLSDKLIKTDDLNNIIGKKYELKYSINDINFIVVDNDITKKKISGELVSIKGEKYSNEQIYYLLTKVISLEEINNNL